MIRNPQHGYGSEMNPCIYCRIMKIQKAGKYMRKIGAAFLFTGEVLGQRPMSQFRKAIEIIDRESGFKAFSFLAVAGDNDFFTIITNIKL